MRRLLTRPPLLIGLALSALVVVSLAGWKTVQRVRRPDSSPFVMWDFRAGVEFADLEQSLRSQTRRRFECHELLPDVRYCVMEAYGIDGKVRVVVAPNGRAARIQFVPDSASALMREEGRRLAARWNRIVEPVADPPDAVDPRLSTSRWTTEDERWTAMLRYWQLGSTPVTVQLTDHDTFESVLSNNEALSPTVLVLNKLADSAEVRPLRELGHVLQRVRVGAALHAGSATSRPPSQSTLGARTVCQPVAVDLGAKSGDSRRDRLPDDVADVLLKAVPKLYPGSRLVFGEDTQLIDSTGRGERVSIGPADGEESQGRLAVAIRFPTRETTAMDRLREKAPADFCRVATEVVIAHRAPNGAFDAFHKIAVGQDAVISKVTRIELLPVSVGDTAQLRVHYTATYGTEDWAGAVDWEELIAMESLRPTVRAPVGFRHITEASTLENPGAIVMTKRLERSLELATLEKHSWGHTTRTATVPITADGILEGVTVLRQIFRPSLPNALAKP